LSTTTTIPPGQGTVVFGHHTSVDENNDEDFLTNWEGTGTISGSGDSEKLIINEGEYMQMISPWNLGVGKARITLNKYIEGSGPSISTKYKTGNSVANCESDTWHDYSTYFMCQGYFLVRLER